MEGVLGSFVWSCNDDVVARDMPEYVETPVLLEVGPRLSRIYGAFEGGETELDQAQLVFAEHKLHVRKLDGAFLAVLSSLAVNAAALKMALSLVTRRVS
ncbi:MAG TPA: hypothetical protein VHM19_05025, partial [Polyangiales bacterium]|nr:hypothetical protein [Polyangiales bacterium]